MFKLTALLLIILSVSSSSFSFGFEPVTGEEWDPQGNVETTDDFNDFENIRNIKNEIYDDQDQDFASSEPGDKKVPASNEDLGDYDYKSTSLGDFENSLYINRNKFNPGKRSMVMGRLGLRPGKRAFSSDEHRGYYPLDDYYFMDN